ncbi:hypothetical protein DMJ13_11990 [halophilic archaeon]|nr:hypothetical protein DMJ13_11990 [halophilic archaeon]
MANQRERNWPELTPDLVFDILRDQRRRHVLAYLFGERRPVPIDELTRAVARREFDAPPDSLDDDRLERVCISLVHTHLPKLTQAGLLERNADTDTVELTDRVASLEADLRFAIDEDLEEHYVP